MVPLGVHLDTQVALKKCPEGRRKGRGIKEMEGREDRRMGQDRKIRGGN
jgi:hypothetical protein